MQRKSLTGKIFDNVLFLAEVFGDQDNKDIPKLPVLEMALCLDLKPPKSLPRERRRHKAQPLWK